MPQSKDQSVTQVQTVRNALDSTAPTIRRGKEREKPKKRRPTKMRKIIAAEKAAKSKVSMLLSTQMEIDRSEIHHAIEIEPEKTEKIYNQMPSNNYAALSESESNELKVLITISYKIAQALKYFIPLTLSMCFIDYIFIILLATRKYRYLNFDRNNSFLFNST